MKRKIIPQQNHRFLSSIQCHFFFTALDEKNLFIFWVSNELGEWCQESKTNIIFHEYLARKIEFWTAYRKRLLCLGFVPFEDANPDVPDVIKRQQRRGDAVSLSGPF